jgi:hypothetical protein
MLRMGPGQRSSGSCACQYGRRVNPPHKWRVNFATSGRNYFFVKNESGGKIVSQFKRQSAFVGSDYGGREVKRQKCGSPTGDEKLGLRRINPMR